MYELLRKELEEYSSISPGFKHEIQLMLLTVYRMGLLTDSQHIELNKIVYEK